MSKFATLRIVPGMSVTYNTNEYQVLDLLNSSEVLLEGKSGELITVNANTLSLSANQAFTPLRDLGLDFTRFDRHIIMSKLERRKCNEGYQIYG